MSRIGVLATLHRRLWSLEDRMDLRRQMALATSVLCFAIVGILAIGAAFVGRNEAMRSATDTLNEIAVTFADRLNRGVSTRVDMLKHLAGLEPMLPVWEGAPQTARRMLARTRDSLSDTAWVGFVSPDGVITAAAGGAFEGQSVGRHEWFQLSRERPAVVDSAASGARGGETASAPFADTSIQRIIDIGVPVMKQDGTLVGVLGLYLSRSWAERLRASTAGASDSSQQIGITIFNMDGTVVLGEPSDASLPDDIRRQMIAAGSGVLPDVDRAGNLAAFAVASSSRGMQPSWLVVVRQPTAVAFRAADRVVWAIVGLGALMALAGVIGAVMIAGRVSRPFRQLADKAAVIERGSSEMLPRVRGSLEATRLSSALRALLLRLNNAERSSAEVEGRAAEEARRLSEDIAMLRNLAEVDTLTDMLNRRAFLELAKDAMDHYRRQGRQFAVMMIDIDHFKKINDNLGHAIGDDAIRSVAKTIGRTLRPSDKAARFGGEEFVVLLRDISRFDAVEAAERIRAAVAANPIAVPGSDLFVTVSVGIAISDGLDRDMPGVIERADIALYAAKANGRNCVAVAPAAAAEERRIA